MATIKIKKTPYFFLLPAFVIIFCFLLTPIIFAVILSFTDVSLLGMLKGLNFIGIDNFRNFLTSQDFSNTIGATLIFVFGLVSLSYIGGLLIALLLNQKVRFSAVFRTLLILPWAVPQVVVVLIIKWLLNPQYGLVNYIAYNLGLIPKDFSFFTSGSLAMMVILLTVLWRSYPLSAIILLAGMKSISDDLYEAAEIDGANPIQRFIYITIPGLRHVSLVLILLLIIWGIGNFVFVWLLTGGGPANKTSVLAIFAYKNAFVFGDVGYGAAIGVLALIFSLVVSIIYYMVFMKRAGD